MAAKYDWSKEKAFRVDEDGCLLWRGCAHSDGTPTVYTRTPDGRRKYIAIRRAVLSMLLERPLTHLERAIVVCGKDLCCSPYCVRAVTYAELNKRTADETKCQKTHARRAKLSAAAQKRWRWSADEIADMRARDAAGESRRSIADSYDTTTDRLYPIFEYRVQVMHLDPGLVAQMQRVTR